MSAEPVLSPDPRGLAWGLLGVAGFSLTVPLTRIAVANGAMSPLFVAAGRAVVAAVLAALALALTGQRLPNTHQWRRIAVVTGGVVIGFPMLTSYALTTAPANHSAIVIAILPAATAVVAVLRAHERPPTPFWIAAGAGTVAVMAFAGVRGGGVTGFGRADLLLLGAVVAAAVGYAEGGLLAREIGAWQTISWALVLGSPLMVTLTLVSFADGLPQGGVMHWASFAYLGIVSMFLGFFAWYRGLAIGPMARVGQVQLTQPIMTVGWAAWLLGEPLTWAVVAGGAVVVLCAGTAVRVRRN